MESLKERRTARQAVGEYVGLTVPRKAQEEITRLVKENNFSGAKTKAGDLGLNSLQRRKAFREASTRILDEVERKQNSGANLVNAADIGALLAAKDALKEANPTLAEINSFNARITKISGKDYDRHGAFATRLLSAAAFSPEEKAARKK
jgi:hypothetical protein